MKMMKSVLFGALAALCLSGPAMAQMEIYKDYDVSDSVWNVTTVRVDPGMGDFYLEGLKETWINANKIAKKLGHIEDYFIFGSTLPESGEFNMALVIKYKDIGDLAPSKARYEAFMKEWSEEQDKNSREKVMKDYPKMRVITGEYLMNQIMVK